jgi:hypothetical protein
MRGGVMGKIKWVIAVYAITLILALPCNAQQWAWTYGAASDELGYSMQETADGGIIVAGTTESFGAAATDIWVVKLTAT